MLRRIFRWFVWALALVVGLAICVQLYFFGMLIWWRSNDPEMTAFMSARLAVMRESKPEAKLKQVWVPYKKISDNLKRAVLVAEDDKFIEHEGFDWDGIQKALEKNEKRGKVVAGGSTISQQLAKNLFLSGDRSMLRKGQEAVITLMMEMVMDKRRILEIYLNVIEWGEGVFGAEAAARYYFGVTAAQLSPAQAARLAAMIPRPRFFDRNRGSAYLQRQTETLINRMPNAQLPAKNP
jgi:monofunctional glycosyltransferase